LSGKHSYERVSYYEWLLFGSGEQSSVDFCLWGWMKCEVQKSKFHTRDELVTRILDAAAQIKKT
jgi:hypothetical protein